MKIPTGNFGNVTPQSQQTRVSVGGVTAVGNALSGGGAAVGQVSDDLKQVQDKADIAATQAILTDLESKSVDRWENPQTGALTTRQGFKSSGVGLDMDKQDATDYDDARKKIPASQLTYFDAQWKAAQVRRVSAYNSFERSQTDEAQRQQLNATVTASVEQESSAYDNPMQANLIRGARKHSIELYARARGWSQESIDSAISEANQKALEQRAQNYAVADPVGWLNGNFEQGNSSTGGLDMRAVGLVESGGKHLNADGSIVTSPKGAQGTFQLMPETGKELAAKRGIDYNPNDPEQHAQLARDYSGQLSEKYQSETLAGAAYNWGMGNVDKLISKVGDPRKGEIAMADFVKQLPAETRGWLSRYNKNKTGLDPVSIYKIDNAAQSVIDEQRKSALARLAPIYSNTIAQLENGEVPDAMPDKATINFAYGEQGEQMAKKLSIAVDSAKKFQAIQYLDPARQQAELALTKPQANDPDYALKLDAYGKLGALVQKSNTAIQTQRDTRRFNDALIMGEKLDPNDKAMQKAADYTQAAQNFRVNDADTHNDIIQQVAQTGVIPSQVTSNLQAISRTQSPKDVLKGAELFNRLYETDMASVGDMPKDIQGFYLTVKQLSDAGMSPEAAVEHAQKVTYDQTDAMKKQFASTQSSREYKKEMTKAMESARNSMTQWLRIDPDIDDGSVEYKDALVGGAQFQADYQSLYDINYRAVGGSADVAKKLTNQQIARNWSISSVNGDAKFMKYAPETEYNYGPSGWQSEQWKTEKELLMYGADINKMDANSLIGVVSGGSTSPSQLGVTSGVSPDVRKSLIGGELEIVPDALTQRGLGYAIVVRTKDKNGIEVVSPFYDNDGKLGRWKPSLESWEPYKKMQQERTQREQEEVSKGRALQEFKDKHRAIDEQYKKSHDDRVNNVKNYFSWSNE